MNYTIEIYLYDNKLIFTGTRDLYFEKYKGNGPGVYSQPILCLPSSCSISEIQQALLTCVGVLEQNEKKILDENTSNSVTQMESVLFRNFKSFGIKASKSKIIKSSICILSINHHTDCGCVTGTFCSIKKNHKKGFFMAFL